MNHVASTDQGRWRAVYENSEVAANHRSTDTGSVEACWPDFRLQTSNFKLQTSNFKLRSAYCPPSVRLDHQGKPTPPSIVNVVPVM